VSAHPDIIDALKARGFLPADAEPRLEPLSGGVSSDVFRLETVNGPVCVKRALAKLRVDADWRAPVERSHVEAEWLRAARPLVGAAVPEVLLELEAANLFVMSFYAPETHRIWKAELAAGRTDPVFASRVGALIAKVHAGCAGSQALAGRFATTALFEDLRLAPFLRHAAVVHPELAPRLVALADRTAATRITLVHGDVSPKNILHGPEGPVLLDAECAWYGDPAFDLAFCSAHLLLKTVWRPAFAADFLRDAAALRDAYLAGVDWEPAAEVDARAAQLTAAILLARVDGKSPADYLQTLEDRGFVRETAKRLIAGDMSSMPVLLAAWNEGLATR
jgi:aminoglycoside phosphotransferase (APT) family kinase protein